LSWIQPLTGQENRTESLSLSQPTDQVQTILLPHEDNTGNHILLLVDSSFRVRLISNTASAQETFSKHSGSVFFYEVNEQSITGRVVSKKILDDLYDSIEVWRINFPETTTAGTTIKERVERVAFANWNLHISSPTRILGDRTALGKYLNKNLAAVATIKEVTGKVQPTSSVNIYLIDTITGNIVYHTYHQNTNGPVHLALCENWVVYHYWNSEAHRYEMSVVELYEKGLDWTGTIISSLAPKQKSNEHELTVFAQSFVFPTAIKTMAVTDTRHGIATRQILVGLPSDQILALSKVWLDPRRPPKNNFTEENREEGLIPYDANIPINHKQIINYHNKVLGLREVITTTTQLESTTLVAAHGLDLFFTRTTPSGPFDILNPDFNYFALVVTSVVLIVVTFISMKLSKRKDLERLWR